MAIKEVLSRFVAYNVEFIAVLSQEHTEYLYTVMNLVSNSMDISFV